MNTKDVEALIAKQTKPLVKRINKLERVVEQRQMAEEWVTPREFIRLSGLTNKNARRQWRKDNPDLWKTTKEPYIGEHGRTVNGGFLYNWTAYVRKGKTISERSKNN